MQDNPTPNVACTRHENYDLEDWSYHKSFGYFEYFDKIKYNGYPDCRYRRENLFRPKFGTWLAELYFALSPNKTRQAYIIIMMTIIMTWEHFHLVALPCYKWVPVFGNKMHIQQNTEYNTIPWCVAHCSSRPYSKTQYITTTLTYLSDSITTWRQQYKRNTHLSTMIYHNFKKQG